MLLQNKKTGEIGEFYQATNGSKVCVGNVSGSTFECLGLYNSFAELREEWIDYEESKGFWVIEETGYIQYITNDMLYADWVNGDDFMACCEKIGNRFESKEKAEFAVKKLEALTRLKDKGFRFTAWKNGILLDETIAGQVRYEFPIDNKDDIEKDLDLLFGGEE